MLSVPLLALLLSSPLTGCPDCAAVPAERPAPPAAQCDAARNPHCDELRRIAARADVRRAFEFIAETDSITMRDLIMLTEIPAPPFKEEVRARKYAEMLREAGADTVYIDEEGNVIGVRRGTSGDRSVAVTGHIDTVFPEGTDVTVQQRGDTLFAPGIGDDTRGLMVVLTVLRAMQATDLRTEADLLFIGTVGEEGLGDLRGVKYLFRDGGPRIDAFISVDGDGDQGITHQALGSRRYRVTFKGPGGHSWGAFGTANPVHALGRAIRLFDEEAARFTASGARTSYNVGRIGGGTSVNAIPFEGWMEVDMRSESPASLAAIDSIFRHTMARALAEQNTVHRQGPALEVEVELIGDRPSGETPADAPLVQRAMAAILLNGNEPHLGRSSTDSNLPISLGIPAITIGRGGISGEVHAPGEWWINRDGPRAIQQTLLIVLAEGGLAGTATSSE